MDQHDIITPAEVGEELQIPEATLAQWRHRGIGPRYFRVGRHVRYRRSEVLAWFEARACDAS